MMIRKQTGFSLVELMVAMMIGLFLIFVVISSYSNSKTSSTMRSDLGELESNARIAMSFLRESIEHAGYPSTYVYTIEKPFLTASDGDISGFVCGSGSVNSQVASYINNYNRYTKDNGNKDRISIAYMPDNPKDADALYWQDCAGSYTDLDLAEACSADPVAGLGSEAVVYNSYYIASNELKCTSSRNSPSVPIANGIESMQFRYGVKSANGSVQYQRADVVEDNDDWRKVVSVHVALLVRSPNEVKSESESKKFLLLDKEVTTPDDRYIRKVYTSLIHLANRDR